MANELLIRYASLERADIPGMIQLPTGGVTNTRAIRQQLYGANFHHGDTLVWNTKTSKYTVYKKRTPTQVLAERFSRLSPIQNVASVIPGQSWFSIGATPVDMDAKGAVLFVGKFSPHSLFSKAGGSTPHRSNKNIFFSGLQKSVDVVGSSYIASICGPPPPPPVDTDGDGDPDSTDPDDDGDGMDDVYENAHAVLNPLDKNDAGYDPDNDGLTNLEEFNISPLMDPDNPDTDGDGIQDNIDDDPPVASNFCSGVNAVIENETILDRRQCAAPVSVTITGMVSVALSGDLEVISSTVTIDPEFNVEGEFLLISADPCPACPPLL